MIDPQIWESMNHALSVKEVAALLNASPHTVRYWIKHGKLRGFKVGSQWRFWPDSLRRQLEAKNDLPGIS